jgi:hypothetical protein
MDNSIRKEDTMAKVKEMPYAEKYRMVIDNLKYHETSIQPLVGKIFGDQAVAELKRTNQEGIKPIPEGASFEEKYEIAYGNWVWSGKSVYRFIRKELGEDGIKKFERPNVEALKRKNASPALFLLGLIRVFSPSLAFTMTVRKMAYQLQWLTPFSVSELTKSRAILNTPHCKILDFPETDDFCLVACQHTYPIWMAEQFKISMKWNRQGYSCTGVLVPIK